MEIIFEFLFQIYFEIGEILIPDHKFKKWQEKLLKLFGILVSLAIVALIIAGGCILNETPKSVTGIVLLSIGCILLFVQIVLFIVVIVHQIKKEKRGKTY